MSYYAIMPAPVRYSRTLTPTDKLVYSELAARAQGNLACFEQALQMGGRETRRVAFAL